MIIRIHENTTYSPRSKKFVGLTWSIENLSVDDGKGGIFEKGGEHYYTWDAAVRVAKSIPGWRLPTPSEFEKLAEYLSYETDSTVDEFNIVLAGEGFLLGKPAIYGEGEVASFWTSEYLVTADLLDDPQELVVGKLSDTYGDSRYTGCSVRLVKEG